MPQTERQFSVLPCSFSSFLQKKGEKAEARKLPGKREGKLTPTETTCRGHFGFEIIYASEGTSVFCPPLFLFILFAKKGENAKSRQLSRRKKKQKH